MEQNSYIENVKNYGEMADGFGRGKKLSSIILLKYLSEFESAAYESENSLGASAVAYDYLKFRKQFDTTHEKIGSDLDTILAVGGSKKLIKKRSYELLINHPRSVVGVDEPREYEIFVNGEKKGYLKITRDVLSVYTINDVAISPDGKFIALLIEETDAREEDNKRKFVVIYRNSGFGTAEYFGGFVSKEDGLGESISWWPFFLKFSGKKMGFPLMNALISQEKPHKIPHVSVNKTSSDSVWSIFS